MPADFTTQMQPNSQHQLWSQWTFVVRVDDFTRRPGKQECIDNFRKWVKLGFQTDVGRGECDLLPRRRYQFKVQIEGPPAHDPGYRLSVKRNFTEHFVTRGFGPGAVLEDMDVAVLAGDSENGTPPAQMIVMPLLDLKSLLEE